jgi:hypothetical protein
MEPDQEAVARFLDRVGLNPLRAEHEPLFRRALPTQGEVIVSERVEEDRAGMVDRGDTRSVTPEVN